MCIDDAIDGYSNTEIIKDKQPKKKKGGIMVKRFVSEASNLVSFLWPV